ncbi:MAG: phage baseplate assembly protein V [Candidatus Methylumidiphilus sp.]
MDRATLFERPPGWLNASYLGRVVSLSDPDGNNRIQIRLIAFDGLGEQDAPIWARVVSPFAGDNRGVFFLPDVDDEVLVVFMNGDVRFPLIIGGLWNGNAQSPATIGSEGNRYKVLRSKNGIKLTMDDKQGQETFKLETPGGQKVTLKDGPGSITIEDSNGNSIKMESAGITIKASAKVTVQAAKVDVTAGMVNVDTAMAKFSGMVKCEVLQATSVIATSYTPGAGNIW